MPSFMATVTGCWDLIRVEHPVALQLGGCDPAKLSEAARIGEDFGYDEINLNVGCPSDRVQSGTFGACLMKSPHLVGDCVAAMRASVSIPVTVKCRIGVDDQDPEKALDVLADAVFAAGADAFWVHARKAWLEGLSPKENRDIPPLDYDRVYRLKVKYENKFIGINGGIQTLDEVSRHLDQVDGAMLGRAAYHTPGILAEADRLLGERKASRRTSLRWSKPWQLTRRGISSEAAGLAHVTRHMVGLFHGLPGARRYRQILSTEATRAGAGPDVLLAGFAAVEPRSGSEAA